MSLYLLGEAGSLAGALATLGETLDSAGRASTHFGHFNSGPFFDDDGGEAGADLFQGATAPAPGSMPKSGSCPPGTHPEGSLEFPTCVPNRSVRIGGMAFSTPLAPAQLPTPPTTTQISPATPPAPSPYQPSVTFPSGPMFPTPDTPAPAPAPSSSNGGGGGGAPPPASNTPLYLLAGTILLLLYFGRKKQRR